MNFWEVNHGTSTGCDEEFQSREQYFLLGMGGANCGGWNIYGHPVHLWSIAEMMSFPDKARKASGFIGFTG